jgi:hypothetical protein
MRFMVVTEEVENSFDAYLPSCIAVGETKEVS